MATPILPGVSSNQDTPSSPAHPPPSPTLPEGGQPANRRDPSPPRHQGMGWRWWQRRGHREVMPPLARSHVGLLCNVNCSRQERRVMHRRGTAPSRPQPILRPPQLTSNPSPPSYRYSWTPIFTDKTARLSMAPAAHRAPKTIHWLPMTAMASCDTHGQTRPCTPRPGMGDPQTQSQGDNRTMLSRLLQRHPGCCQGEAPTTCCVPIASWGSN